ncbi:MAG: twin-arginine translocation signal domain-containing protein, partial [Pseudomonadota bacterium]
MNDRRDFLQLAALLAVAAPATAQAADAAPKARGEIARYPLGGALAGNDAVLVDLIAQPGVATGAAGHRHPGMVMGYVLESAYAFAINGEAPKIINAGETFFEEAGALHTGTGSADATKPAHLLAFMIVPTGQPLVLP